MCIVWVPIALAPMYEVNERGDIRNSKTKRILKQQVHPAGYHHVGLQVNKKLIRFYVHRLVAQAFIGLDYEKDRYEHQVNHIDCNKGNNNMYNLEVVSQTENINHAFANGLINPRQSKQVLQDGELWLINKLLNEWYRSGTRNQYVRRIAKMFRVTDARIFTIKRRKEGVLFV